MKKTSLNLTRQALGSLSLCLLLSSTAPSLTVAQDLKPVASPAAKEKTKEQVKINIRRHAPCNLFNTTQPVVFEAGIGGLPAGTSQLDAVLTDESGREIAKKTVSVEAAPGKGSTVSLDFGQPGRGYYELIVSYKGKNAAGEPIDASSKATLGVMEFVSRTAKEVRDGGYAFGLKWWGGIQNLREMEDAMTKLGLQWTRIIQNEGGKATTPGRMTTAQILSEYPMNAAIKVERFPREMYDVERYGPLEEWEVKYGKGAWVLKTVPKKEPYQAWLREQIAAIPADQQVFEIWNEPWDKMSPEDFAKVCQYIAEVILKDRPNAILGPNLYGNTSPYEYDLKLIKAGGLKGMKMVALHPYAGSENREWFRGYRKWLKEQTGTDMDIYITEYGSHSTPEGPARRSEMEQARRVVRQSIALYAEGAKALIPHWAGQSEKTPTYIEDWFGFVRKNEQPKPVLLAHANCARLIDGSRYIGDLWYGPGVGASVFEKNGSQIVALWTLGTEGKAGEENTARAEIEVEPGVPEVVVTDILGRENKLKAENGKVKLTLDESPIYLVGVAPSMTRVASKDLREDRWPKPAKPARAVRISKKLQAEPVLDGKFSDWKGAAELGLLNPKVAGADCSGTGYIGWDENNLYIGVDVRDNEMLNKESRAKLYRQDSVELFVSTEPRDSGRGYGPNDHQFFLTPTSGEGKPIVGEVTDREAGVVEDVKGAKVWAGPMHKEEKGWAMEVAIPWTSLNGFKPSDGRSLAVDILLNDADTSHERFKLKAVDSPENFSVIEPSTWGLLKLEP
ncbi:MAG: sugar-binding protein [Candidatus Methylacidiphilales bacterium]